VEYIVMVPVAGVVGVLGVDMRKGLLGGGVLQVSTTYTLPIFPNPVGAGPGCQWPVGG
jgi:hypothetical protein